MVWAALALAVVSIALLIREKMRGEAHDAQFRLLADGAPSAMVVFDDRHVLYANQRGIEIVGTGNAADVNGRSLDDVLAPATAQLARDIHKQVLASGEPLFVEDVPVTGRNGAVARCDLSMVPVDFDGISAVQGAFVPVGEGHEAVVALRQTEERFRRFFDDMPVPMYRTRPDGTIVHANHALARMLGVPDAAALVGTDAADFYTDDGERERLAAIQQDQGLLEDQISVLSARDGRPVWVRDSSHTIVEQDGQIFEGALVDVTEEQRATRELKLRATQQEALAHIGQVALGTVDIAELLNEAVDQVCEVLDADCVTIAQHQEGQGLSTTAVAYRVDSVRRREQVFNYLSEYAESAMGTVQPIALPAIAVDEGVRELSGVALGISGSTEIYGVVGVARSGSEISAKDMSFLRTTALTLGSAIERARARARMRELMLSKDEFVASVSHELRTPLTVVAGLALELEQSWRSFSAEEIAEFISLIADQSREMSDLIEDLLVVARADIGRVPIYPEQVDIRSCIDQVVASCSLADRARMTVSGDSVWGLVDPVRCRQVVRNLVTNAIRYGGPRIHISVANHRHHALVAVFDDGSGIPEPLREKVFAPYERAHSSSGVPGSVGLGLTVSQKLTELMDGEILYRYDGGSFFEVLLPLVEEAESATSRPPVTKTGR